MKMETNENKKQNRNCVAFATHKMDKGIQNYLAYLRKEVAGVMDLIVLYDQSTHPIRPEDYPDYRFFFFDSTQLKGFFHQNNRLLPNTLVALIACAQTYRYEHYLLMENDILLQGRFHEFIERVNQETPVDYIHIATDVSGGTLQHWPIRYIRDCPFEQLHFAWCHLLYISLRFLKDVAEFMEKNDSIHYEFLLPTMAYAGHYGVRQFENFGYHFYVSWGPAEYYEALHGFEQTYNTFYHPIKHMENIAFENL